jgi:hypothetical protein
MLYLFFFQKWQLQLQLQSQLQSQEASVQDKDKEQDRGTVTWLESLLTLETRQIKVPKNNGLTRMATTANHCHCRRRRQCLAIAIRPTTPIDVHLVIHSQCHQKLQIILNRVVDVKSE